MAAFFQTEITNSGGTFSIDPSIDTEVIWHLYLTSAVTLSADLNLLFDNPPPIGGTITIITNFISNGGLDLNGKFFDIDGGMVNLSQDAVNMPFRIVFTRVDNPPFTRYDIQCTYGLLDIGTYAGFSGDLLLDGSVSIAKLATLTAGQLILGNASNIPTATTVSGDITINSSGVTAIGSGVIVNADINTSAAIARIKIASGTASHVIINDGSGAFSSEAQLAVSRGGTGISTSASTGFPTISTGTWSVGSIAVDRDLDVSFEAGETGDFKIYMGFDGTLTNIYAYVTKAIAGTDNGTIVPKNNAGTTMGTGTITFTASDPRGTAYSATPSTNNTFSDRDLLTFTTAKTTSGGKVHLSLKFTRNS